MNTPNSQIFINKPGGDFVISFLNIYLDLNFEAFKKADNSRYANGNEIRRHNLGPIAWYSNFKLKTSSGKHLEDISHAHFISLMHNIV